MNDVNKPRRGFASLDPARMREVASNGGKTAHAKGTAHKWTSESAAAAGRKGGESRARKLAASNPFTQAPAVQSAPQEGTGLAQPA